MIAALPGEHVAINEALENLTAALIVAQTLDEITDILRNLRDSANLGALLAVKRPERPS